MGIVEKRGDFQFRARVRRKGQPDLSKTFETKKDAEDWKREVERKIDRGEIDGLDRETQRTTVDEAIESYREKVMPGMARGGKGTIDVYLRRISMRFGPLFIVSLRAKEINQWTRDLARPADAAEDKKVAASASMQRYRERLKAERLARLEGRELPPRTPREQQPLAERGLNAQSIIHHMNTFSSLFQHAQTELGVFAPAGNPLQLAKRPSPGNARDRILREGEFELLIRAARDKSNGRGMASSGMMEPIICLAIETSMRESELLALRRDWISMKHRTIALPAEITKNSEARTVAISATAHQVLSAMTPHINGRVFWNWKDLNSFGKPWQRLLKRARRIYGEDCAEKGVIPDPTMLADLRFHDLRHDATTKLFSKGLNPFEVASMTGHKSMQMLRRYTHVQAKELARKLG